MDSDRVKREMEDVLKMLFEETQETGVFIKQKGADGFFLSIKNSPVDAAQRAWRSSCGTDGVAVENALSFDRFGNVNKATIPKAFVEKWNAALSSVFNKRFKDRTQLSGREISGWHVYQLRLKTPLLSPS